MSGMTGLAFLGNEPRSNRVAIDTATDALDAHPRRGGVTDPRESPSNMIIPSGSWLLAAAGCGGGQHSLFPGEQMLVPAMRSGSDLADDECGAAGWLRNRDGDRRDPWYRLTVVGPWKGAILTPGG